MCHQSMPWCLFLFFYFYVKHSKKIGNLSKLKCIQTTKTIKKCNRLKFVLNCILDRIHIGLILTNSSLPEND